MGCYLISGIYSGAKNADGVVSTAENVAAYTGIKPPNEATGLRVEHFERQQFRLTFVRFKAPPQICRVFAAKIMPKAVLANVDYEQAYADAMAVYMASSVGKLDLQWFDLPYVISFWSVQSGRAVFSRPSIESVHPGRGIIGADVNTETTGYATTSIRIDDINGVFYFLQTN